MKVIVKWSRRLPESGRWVVHHSRMTWPGSMPLLWLRFKRRRARRDRAGVFMNALMLATWPAGGRRK